MSDRFTRRHFAVLFAWFAGLGSLTAAEEEVSRPRSRSFLITWVSRTARGNTSQMAGTSCAPINGNAPVFFVPAKMCRFRVKLHEPPCYVASF